LPEVFELPRQQITLASEEYHGGKLFRTLPHPNFWFFTVASFSTVSPADFHSSADTRVSLSPLALVGLRKMWSVTLDSYPGDGRFPFPNRIASQWGHLEPVSL